MLMLVAYNGQHVLSVEQLSNQWGIELSVLKQLDHGSINKDNLLEMVCVTIFSP